MYTSMVRMFVIVYLHGQDICHCGQHCVLKKNAPSCFTPSRHFIVSKMSDDENHLDDTDLSILAEFARSTFKGGAAKPGLGLIMVERGSLGLYRKEPLATSTIFQAKMLTKI